jgi:hypothetical protein
VLQVESPVFDNLRFGDAILGPPTTHVFEMNKHVLERTKALFRACLRSRQPRLPKREKLVHRSLVRHQGVKAVGKRFGRITVNLEALRWSFFVNVEFCEPFKTGDAPGCFGEFFNRIAERFKDDDLFGLQSLRRWLDGSDASCDALEFCFEPLSLLRRRWGEYARTTTSESSAIDG